MHGKAKRSDNEVYTTQWTSVLFAPQRVGQRGRWSQRGLVVGPHSGANINGVSCNTRAALHEAPFRGRAQEGRVEKGRENMRREFWCKPLLPNTGWGFTVDVSIFITIRPRFLLL